MLSGKAEGQSTPATLTPSSGTLSTSQTFTWNNGVGVTEYSLFMGTAGFGSTNLLNCNETKATTVKVSIPSDGVTVYARFYQLINGVWQYADYEFTEPGTPMPATLSPSSGTLATSQTFAWSNGAGPAAYQLLVGTTGTGSSNVYSSGSTTATSTTVSMQAGSTKVYVRLMQLIDDAWQSTDYTFTSTEAGTLTPATLTPSSGTLAASQTFTWSNGVGPTEYSLFLGTTGFGSTNIANMNETTETSAKVSIPSDGVTVYARFYQLINGAWQYTDYEFTEPGTMVPATLTPASGSLAASQTFTWSNGMGPAAYQLLVGTTGVGSSNVYSSGSTTATSTTVSFQPDGATVYVRLMQLIDDAWQSTDYAFTEPGPPTPATLTPSSGTLATSQTFTWSNGIGVTEYSLFVGTTGFGSTNIANLNETTATSAKISIPSNGATVYARFYQLISGAWQYTDYEFTEPALYALTLQSTSVPFGDVTDGSPAYQSVKLTSSGMDAVTVSAGSVSGTGYTISGVSFPTTLNPGQTATLQIEFDPTTPGLSDGTVTLTSNSSAGTTSTIGLSGTGVSTSTYEVSLNWDAPTGTGLPVAGYDVYRAVSGSSTYELLNSSLDTTTTYTDTTVQSGTSYVYYVESVDDEGNQGPPSNDFDVSIP